MISTKATRIWTPYGYLFVDDLFIGEKVISFNPERGVCEYDSVQSIEMEYKRCMGFGINSKSMRQLVTPDHPILIWDSKNKLLERIPIRDKFMVSFAIGRDKSILAGALFEPYKRTRDLEDIKWSARIAATMSAYRRAEVGIREIVSDLGGYEAQCWLDTFFHWNKLMPAKNWMKTVICKNFQVRDIVSNIAPRGGVGMKNYTFRGKNLLSISTDGFIYPRAHISWYKQEINEPVFNLKTRNGNILARSSNGTFLIACDEGDK